MLNNQNKNQNYVGLEKRKEHTSLFNSIKIRGRFLTKGIGEGEIIATEEPLSFWGGFDPTSGEIIDHHHLLYGHNISGKILVLPGGRGSSSGSGVLLEAIQVGTAPAAILMNRTDEVIALGAIVADEIFSLKLPIMVLNKGLFSQAITLSYAYIDYSKGVCIAYPG